MKNYQKMTVRELQREMEMHGNNYYGMTKAMMVESLINTDRARSMSNSELLQHLINAGKI